MAASSARRRSPSAGRMFPSRSRPRDRLISLESTGGRAWAGTRQQFRQRRDMRRCGCEVGKLGPGGLVRAIPVQRRDRGGDPVITAPFLVPDAAGQSGPCVGDQRIAGVLQLADGLEEGALGLWPPRGAGLVLGVGPRSLRVSCGWHAPGGGVASGHGGRRGVECPHVLLEYAVELGICSKTPGAGEPRSANADWANGGDRVAAARLPTDKHAARGSLYARRCSRTVAS
jgi:hypothetical protein